MFLLRWCRPPALCKGPLEPYCGELTLTPCTCKGCSQSTHSYSLLTCASPSLSSTPRAALFFGAAPVPDSACTPVHMRRWLQGKGHAHAMREPFPLCFATHVCGHCPFLSEASLQARSVPLLLLLFWLLFRASNYYKQGGWAHEKCGRWGGCLTAFDRVSHYNTPTAADAVLCIAREGCRPMIFLLCKISTISTIGGSDCVALISIAALCAFDTSPRV